MNSIPGYIEKHPQEEQRLVGLNYDQLKQLIKQAITMHAEVESEAERIGRALGVKRSWSKTEVD